ncbi:uncharacterized protein si:ch211-197h24.6 isoform X2 [Corythoichthys intestinalis]|uniref:uncharacterized protein si:ch211-197h24.6 isoform X2 n=1 Tax=Corythoichthys intestinalis TaxID=161448 RepID=UPI0025A52D6D|nr:uncharacterized protein si:ch211-197h24.6 isoform X2 [Corythoichthys intestinalis]XP_057691497.1 uncharacterized protein si:ch211-197h24.6 isoform X2 [Corythoichthys intestinalis]XP_057691498.1 uncharacterized protein si:ch211-197h24.6 isoform X2 [Corythoichthys intestinalis]XP_057691500.1 uncharacterized protein si:ch211-197h24.6 isoform X2 [Corythoichthys intestinalis]
MESKFEVRQVYVKGTTFVTIPSLGKLLGRFPNTAVGLHHVFEYRSPSKTVPPHYECKLCSVLRLQQDMFAHVKSWKHNLKYLETFHPDKVPSRNEDAGTDAGVRKRIKDATEEVAKSEGMGQVKVVIKEPFRVPAFRGARTAVPKPLPFIDNGMGPNGPPPAPLLKDQSFCEELPPNEDPYDDYTDEYDETNSEPFPPKQRFPDLDTFQGDFEPSNFKRSNFERFSPEPQFRDRSPGPFPHGPRGDFRPNNQRDRFDSGRFPEQFKGIQMGGKLMDRPVEKPFGRRSPMASPPDRFDSNESNPNPLLHYLDKFQIKNESDAQLVLKVTQKLTDLLMEYRLTTISQDGPSRSILPLTSSFDSRPSSNLPRSMDRFSRPFSKGQSRFPDGPRRF